ncbi:unnamed protein product [Cylindrotheca closterium]|uniref:Methylenetetrahydrofolate reductase (NAD(P)H) n=1 Tax=Cylindrotheca closterium TaxID=2856 RepID=A0AAD2PTX9_9STRA|nr:unnamed protein product [Cylindrotheca closterium]
MATSSAQDDPLSRRMANPARPVFLLGEVPPGEGTQPGKCLEIATKFAARSRALATDGFIVYDIQDEPGRSDIKRPFPFRHLMNSSKYASLLAKTANKPCCVYKCVADAEFDNWIDTAVSEHGHSAVNLVGRASSTGEYVGPTISEAMKIVNAKKGLEFGCVCIAERHTLEAAKARGKDYPTEHLNMLRKQKAGAEWFISQAVYDAEPTIRLLKDYAASCREQGIVPRKVILTFAPVSRQKTMNFIKWLGVRVPEETESKILNAEQPVDESVKLLCDMLKEILEECSGIGVPLGISCESVSIYKKEIDAVHELFRKLQDILLTSRGTPWVVQWVEVMPPAGLAEKKVLALTNSDARNDSQSKSSDSTLTLLHVLLGAALVTFGTILGSSLNGSRKK